MNKSELRKKYVDKRNSLGFESISDLSLKITEKLFETIEFKNQTIHVFHSIASKKEVNTQFIISKLKEEFKAVKIVHSKSNFETFELIHFLYTETTQLVTSKWGIPEPESGKIIKEEEIDIVLVPLLAYDKNGFRVGYGKGFYDKFLSKCKKEVIKIGLSFFPPENKIEDTNMFDIPMDYCITPDKVYKFT